MRELYYFFVFFFFFDFSLTPTDFFFICCSGVLFQVLQYNFWNKTNSVYPMIGRNCLEDWFSECVCTTMVYFKWYLVKTFCCFRFIYFYFIFFSSYSPFSVATSPMMTPTLFVESAVEMPLLEYPLRCGKTPERFADTCILLQPYTIYFYIWNINAISFPHMSTRFHTHLHTTATTNGKRKKI